MRKRSGYIKLLIAPFLLLLMFMALYQLFFSSGGMIRLMHIKHEDQHLMHVSQDLSGKNQKIFREILSLVTQSGQEAYLRRHMNWHPSKETYIGESTF